MQPFPKIKVNGQYVLKEKIGQGSFGQVYKGNLTQNRVICIKGMIKNRKGMSL
jgi:serine/threonine protein kinase